MLPKIDEYVKTFKDKGWDNNKNNKLMSLRVDDDKLLEKYKTIWRQNTELETLVIYDDTYIKIEIERMVIKFILIFVVQMYRKID